MTSFSDSMAEYRRQLNEGHIQRAYRGLLDYFGRLRAHFNAAYPELPTSSSIYQGYMDMTYFAIFPEALKARKLKIALVFLHEEYQISVWLSGANRDVQERYWNLVGASDWNEFRRSADPRREDFLLEHVLVQEPDFGDLESLTAQIEEGTLDFISKIEKALDRIER